MVAQTAQERLRVGVATERRCGSCALRCPATLVQRRPRRPARHVSGDRTPVSAASGPRCPWSFAAADFADSAQARAEALGAARAGTAHAALVGSPPDPWPHRPRKASALQPAPEPAGRDGGVASRCGGSGRARCRRGPRGSTVTRGSGSSRRVTVPLAPWRSTAIRHRSPPLFGGGVLTRLTVRRTLRQRLGRTTQRLSCPPVMRELRSWTRCLTSPSTH